MLKPNQPYSLFAIFCATAAVNATAGVSNYLFQKTTFPYQGFYLEGGLGDGFTHVAALNNMNAFPPGNYAFPMFDGSTGYLLSSQVTAARQGSGLAWTVGAGYQFNPNFAVQMDYFGFHTANLNLQSYLDTDVTYPFIPIPTYATVKKSAFDLVLRGMFEVAQTGLHLYGKAGLGVLGQQIAHGFNLDFFGYNQQLGVVRFNQTVTSATLGVGAVYYIGNNLNLDVNWQHFFGRNAEYAFDKVPGADFVGVSLSYIFRLTYLQN